jgi:hypothetical protein
VPSCLEVGVDALLERVQTKFLESFTLAARPRLVREIRERWSVPEVERLCELASRDESAEAFQVVVLRFDTKDVTVRRRLEARTSIGVRSEEFPQSRNVDTEARAGFGRRVLVPNGIDQALSRHELVGVQQQDRQDRSLLSPTKSERLTGRGDLQRAEDAKLHCPFIVPRCFGICQGGFAACMRAATGALDDQVVSRPIAAVALAAVAALAAALSAGAYERPQRLNDVALMYSLGTGEVRCPSAAEWESDFGSSFGYAYTNLAEDYAVLSPLVCAGVDGVGSTRIPHWQQALGVLVLVHESFHLRHWRWRRNEGKVECQAMVYFREAAVRLGATESDAYDLYAYAIALHDYKLKVFPQYRDRACRLRPWAPPESP